MSGYTQGEWKITEQSPQSAVALGTYGDPGDCAIYVDGHGGPLAEVFARFVSRDDCRPDEARANARLIAAAPELLEACEQVYKNGLGQPELFLLEKAIAKAMGDA